MIEKNRIQYFGFTRYYIIVQKEWMKNRINHQKTDERKRNSKEY
jgi:hypothetical protein